MRERDWCVMRQDDNGNRVVMASALTEPEARLLAASYETRGHKQMYWIEPMASGGPAVAAAAPGPATRR
jgi:hypothetical protein